MGVTNNRAMSETTKHTGGCLCGAVRYEATGEPSMAGYCFCEDCQKASGYNQKRRLSEHPESHLSYCGRERR